MTEQYTPSTSEVRELIAEARFYESAGHVAAYPQSALELLRRLADALVSVRAERDAEVAAKAYAQGVGRTLEVLGTATSPGDGLLTLIGNPYQKAVQS